MNQVLSRRTSYSLRLIIVLIIGGWIAVNTFFVYGQENISAEKKSELERQVEALEKEAVAIDSTVQQIQGEKRTLANAVKTFEAEVKRREVEIRRLNLAIQRAGLEIKNKGERIEYLSEKIGHSHKILSASMLFLYARDQESTLSIFLKHHSISEFFNSLYELARVQSHLQNILKSFKEDRVLVIQEKGELEDFQMEQGELKSLQEIERRLLAQKKKEKDELLRLTKGKEELFQKLLQSKKKDIASLKTQLFYLERTGITAEEALRLAELAAGRAGIRTAFLLALLEVETGKQFEDGVISVGTNLGTGNWRRDMYDCYIALGKRSTAEAQKNAFFAITEGLGLDPDKMPVSRRPHYGCGGAMGPAQFLPSTWRLFESRVAGLTGHNPANPWNTEDAFTASAVYLADAGADLKTTSAEIAAAKAYISGNPRCTKSICIYYSSRIVALAREIDRVL